MINEIYDLNFEVSKLIEKYESDSLRNFKDYFESFVKKFYYSLDDNNKGEYYYKVVQTYNIFSSLIAEKDDYDSIIRVVYSRKHFANMLGIIYSNNAISHSNLARELGISSQALSDFVKKLPNLGLIYKLDYTGTVYSLTRKGKIITENIYHCYKFKGIIEQAKKAEKMEKLYDNLSKRVENIEYTINYITEILVNNSKNEKMNFPIASIGNNDYFETLNPIREYPN